MLDGLLHLTDYVSDLTSVILGASVALLNDPTSGPLSVCRAEGAAQAIKQES